MFLPEILVWVFTWLTKSKCWKYIFWKAQVGNQLDVIYSLWNQESDFPFNFNCSYYGDWALRRGELMSLQLRPQREAKELDLIPGFVTSVTELSFVKHLIEASSTILKLCWNSVVCNLCLQNETIEEFYPS